MTIPREFRYDLFWRKVQKSTNGCQEWAGAKTSAGYGVINVRGKLFYAHRVSYEIAFRDPDKLHVLHKCDNPSCVNPQHLFIGTQCDNNKDKTAKGRCPRGSEHYKTMLSDNDVIEIRNRYANGDPQESIAKLHGISQKEISLIVRGKRWKHVGGPIQITRVRHQRM